MKDEVGALQERGILVAEMLDPVRILSDRKGGAPSMISVPYVELLAQSHYSVAISREPEGSEKKRRPCVIS